MLRLAKLFLFFSLTSLFSEAQAFFDDYLPLTKAETERRFPMQYLGELAPNTKVIQVGKRTLHLQLDDAKNELQLSTTEDQVSSLSFSTDIGMLPYEMYQADLDHNGEQDFILLKPTAGNGLAPSQHLLVLAFDQQGKATPWEVEGYFASDKQGIADLLDLNADGRAELVYMAYGNGYWSTELYQIQDGRWQRIKGTFAGRHYPLLTRFTIKPNKKITPANKVKQLDRAELANTKPLITGYLKSYAWADVNTSEDITLLIQTKQGLVKCQPSSWYSLFTLVLDRAKQREILNLGANPATVQAALNQLVQNKTQVKLYGQRSKEACSPEQLWAVLN
jgi:hypothetical protein